MRVAHPRQRLTRTRAVCRQPASLWHRCKTLAFWRCGSRGFSRLAQLCSGRGRTSSRVLCVPQATRRRGPRSARRKRKSASRRTRTGRAFRRRTQRRGLRTSSSMEKHSISLFTRPCLVRKGFAEWRPRRSGQSGMCSGCCRRGLCSMTADRGHPSYTRPADRSRGDPRTVFRRVPTDTPRTGRNTGDSLRLIGAKPRRPARPRSAV